MFKRKEGKDFFFQNPWKYFKYLVYLPASEDILWNGSHEVNMKVLIWKIFRNVNYIYTHTVPQMEKFLTSKSWFSPFMQRIYSDSSETSAQWEMKTSEWRV